MSDWYILKDKIPVKASLMESMEWSQEQEKKIVKRERIRNILVSTIFLGLDHSFYRQGPPVLFETMIFGGKLDQYQNRYCTWEEAEKGHKQAYKMALKEASLWDLIYIYFEPFFKNATLIYRQIINKIR